MAGKHSRNGEGHFWAGGGQHGGSIRLKREWDWWWQHTLYPKHAVSCPWQPYMGCRGLRQLNSWLRSEYCHRADWDVTKVGDPLTQSDIQPVPNLRRIQHRPLLPGYTRSETNCIVYKTYCIIEPNYPHICLNPGPLDSG